MAVLLTQCLYLPDVVRGIEYFVDRQQDEGGAIHESVSSLPYGTAMITLFELDTTALIEIEKIWMPFFPIASAEDFAQKRARIRWALEQTEALVRRLPDLLRLYRSQTLHLIQACTQTNGGNTALLHAVREGELQAIQTGALQIIRLCAQLRTLFESNLFEVDVTYTPAQRTQRLFEMLGEDAATMFSLTSLPFEPYILDIPEDGPTLCMPLLLTGDLRPLVIVLFNDLVQGHQQIASCGHCGKPFVKAGKAVYCDRVQDKAGNTCKQLGAMARYRKTLEESPAKRAYRQAYKRQFSRAKAGTLDQADFQEWKRKAKARLAKLKDQQEEAAFIAWLTDWKPGQ